MTDPAPSTAPSAAPTEVALDGAPRWPQVLLVMGSRSDWTTVAPADALLRELGVDHGCAIVSAHRTPDRLTDVGRRAAAMGTQVLIAAAGGAAHLPGMLAAHTRLPVFGVPVASRHLQGLDSLLSIVQMPRGVPVGTLAVGEAGAVNAALLAAAVLALADPALAARLEAYRARQAAAALAEPLDTPDRFEP